MSAKEREMRVLDAIRSIPEGFVRTYGDVSPGAPRLAGRLLGSVHAADLPWWRVVRADGSLAAGEEQRRRLEREGVPFRPGPAGRVDLRSARIARVARPTNDEAAGSGRLLTKKEVVR